MCKLFTYISFREETLNESSYSEYAFGYVKNVAAQTLEASGY
jgi:hypothetical protein